MIIGGAEWCASWALDTILAGSRIVTAPLPVTRSTSWASMTSTIAAVSSSTPMPSSCGLCATIISSRP